MLKSKLNKFNLKSGEVLSLEQQRQVRGGLAVSADCDNGGSVSCSGYECTARDMLGCSCRDSGGNLTDSSTCITKLAPIAPAGL